MNDDLKGISNYHKKVFSKIRSKGSLKENYRMNPKRKKTVLSGCYSPITKSETQGFKLKRLGTPDWDGAKMGEIE